jgi:hypothetical protein
MASAYFRPLTTFLIAFSAVTATGEIQVGGPVSVSSGIPAWQKSFSRRLQRLKREGKLPPLGLTECRESEELKDVFLCLSSSQKEMNAALLRASFFVEGLSDRKNKGKIIPQTDPGYRETMKQVNGHDLRSADLLRFHESAMRACETSGRLPSICFNSRESEFFDRFILPRAAALPDFVLISFANRSSMGWHEVVSHEILHAQYFANPVYREIVDRYFDTELSQAERVMVRHHLSGTYDTTDELLIRNEFQAYILMAGAETSLLQGFIKDHRTPLMTSLANANLHPIQVTPEGQRK